MAVAKSLDALLEYLLGEVALSGDQGCTPAQVLAFIDRFYQQDQDAGGGGGGGGDDDGEKETANQPGAAVAAQADSADCTNTMTTETTETTKKTKPLQQRRATVDRRFHERAWTWLSRHPDISVGKERQFNKLSLAELEVRFSSPPSLPSPPPVDVDDQAGEKDPAAATAAATPATAEVEERSESVSAAATQTIPNRIEEAVIAAPLIAVEREDAVGVTSTVPLESESLNSKTKSITFTPSPVPIQNESPVDDAESNSVSKQAPSTPRKYHGPRMYATESRTYLAICGHSRDLTKIVDMEFDLLSIIASTRERGILQSDLTRISGQDKRSVPKRTDGLTRKGYIEKKAVHVRGSRTSRLTLRKFVSVTKRIGELSEDQNTDVGPFVDGEGEEFDLKAFITGFFNILHEIPIVRNEDIRERLNMSGTYRRKIVARTIQKFETIGCVQRVKAAPLRLGKDEKFNKYRCVKFIRDPTNQELRRYHEAGSVTEKTFTGDDDTGSEDDGENAREESVKSPSDDISQAHAVQRIIPQWNPNRPVASLLVETVRRAGTAGITNLEIRDSVVGPFLKRLLEHLIGHISTQATTSSSPYVRQLAFVRDTALSGTIAHFKHFSYDSFAELVRRGEAFWEGVLEADGGRQGKPGKAKTSVAIEAFDRPIFRDEFGFPLRDAPQNQYRSGQTTLSDAIRRSGAVDFTLTKGDPVVVELEPGVYDVQYGMRSQPRRSVTPPAPTGSPSHARSDSPLSTPSPTTGKRKHREGPSGRPRKFLRGTEKFWQRQFMLIREEFDPDYRRGKKAGNASSPAAQALFSSRPPAFDETLVKAVDRGLPVPETRHQILQGWVDRTNFVLQRATGGLWISAVGENPYPHTKESQTSQLLILRSARLKEINFSKGQTVSVESLRHQNTPQKTNPSQPDPRLNFQQNVMASLPITPVQPAIGILKKKAAGPRAKRGPRGTTVGARSTPPAITTPAQPSPGIPVSSSDFATPEIQAVSTEVMSSPQTTPAVSRKRKVTGDAPTPRAGNRKQPIRERGRTSAPATGQTPSAAAVQQSLVSTTSPSQNGLPVKRPRGRPRKQPVQEAEAVAASLSTPHEAALAVSTLPAPDESAFVVAVQPNPTTSPFPGPLHPAASLSLVNGPPAAIQVSDLTAPEQSLRTEVPVPRLPDLQEIPPVEEPVPAETTKTAFTVVSTPDSATAEKELATRQSVEYSRSVNEISSGDEQELLQHQQLEDLIEELEAAGDTVHAQSVQREASHDSEATLGTPMATESTALEHTSGANTSKPSHELSQLLETTFEVDSKSRASYSNPVRGSIGVRRRNIVLNMVDACAGMLPKYDQLIINVFTHRWQKAGFDSAPDYRTIKLAIKTLCDGGKLKQLTFSFRSDTGNVVTRSILVKPEIQHTDPAVRVFQQKMIDAYPIGYEPPELAAENSEQKAKLSKLQHNRPTRVDFQMPESPRGRGIPAEIPDLREPKEPKEPKEKRPPRPPRPPRPSGPRVTTGPRARPKTASRGDRLSATSFINGVRMLPKLVVPRKLGLDSLSSEGTDTGSAANRGHLSELGPSPLNFGTDSTSAPLRFHADIVSGAGSPSLESQSDSIQETAQTYFPGQTNEQKPNITYKKVAHPLPSTLEEILRISTPRNAHEHSKEPNPALSRFVWDVNGVMNWELMSLNLFELRSEECKFINHFLPEPQKTKWSLKTDVVFKKVTALDRSGNMTEVELPPANSNPISQVPFDSMEGSNIVPGLSATPSPRKRDAADTLAGHVQKRQRRSRKRASAAAQNTPKPIKIPRGTQYLRLMTSEQIYRMTCSIIVIRTLAGGLEKYIDWSLVTAVFPHETEEFVRARWKTLRNKYRRQIAALTECFQAKYIRAFEADRVPAVDFENLPGSPWVEIVEWALANLDDPITGVVTADDVEELPATRAELLARKHIVIDAESGMKAWRDQGVYSSLVSNPQREKALLSIPFAVKVGKKLLGENHSRATTNPTLKPDQPLKFRPPAEVEEATDPQLTLAKSWAMATVLTPAASYDAHAALAKLAGIASTPQQSEAVLHRAVKSLHREKILTRSMSTTKTAGLVAGGWDIQKRWAVEIFGTRRMVQCEMLQQAHAFKLGVLDKAFAQGDTVVFDGPAAWAALSDGQMVAICALVAAGRVAVRVLDAARLPGGRYGLDWQNVGYGTRMMDKRTLAFAVALHMQPGGAYVLGNPLDGTDGDAVLPVPRTVAPRTAADINADDDDDDDDDDYDNYGIRGDGYGGDDARSDHDRHRHLIPAWLDIHGALHADVWAMLLAAVVGLVNLRPGIRVTELQRSLAWGLARWELRAILDWAVASRALRRCRRRRRRRVRPMPEGDGQSETEEDACGYETCEWWWLIVGCEWR